MEESEDPADRRDRFYTLGERSALVGVLGHVLDQLGYDDPEAAHLAWIAERERTVATPRSLCAEHGDNDWPDDLHLGDIIEKHLWRHME